MTAFYGQDSCLLDANGRIKLSPHFLSDFRRSGNEVVLHCLAEGALGVYPAHAWEQMRQADAQPAARAAQSLVFRRQLRRFGALTEVETITNQGRVTVPVRFRERLGLRPGTEVVVVGCEIGVEIWNAESWQAEAELFIEHERQRGTAEMAADLNVVPPRRADEP
ncbi:MAG: cell division protein MraZ [Lentisphaerae bacterium ADurb.BinA184]|nr:MAG: cell division protein MraZ [Lentisphaerae bacterium ADurb.BinA184]